MYGPVARSSPAPFAGHAAHVLHAAALGVGAAAGVSASNDLLSATSTLVDRLQAFTGIVDKIASVGSHTHLFEALFFHLCES